MKKKKETMSGNIAIIGAGAAGCFAAINIKRMLPDATVTIYEGGVRPLAKLAVTGGGRCNLTNSFAAVRSLDAVYPRGHRLMKRLLHEFSPQDACSWFENEGIALVTQDDECVFPQSQDAMEIVNMLLRRCRELGIVIKTSCRVVALEHHAGGSYIIRCKSAVYTAACVVVATGGCPRLSGFDWLSPLSLDIIPPVPSLFTLSLGPSGAPGASLLTRSSGTVVASVTVSLVGTKFRITDTLLVTHWGVSGPAVLKLSSMAARHLADNNYRAGLSINWMGSMTDSEVTDMLAEMSQCHPRKLLSSIYPDCLNARLWTHILNQAGIRPTMRWAEMSRKSSNRLMNVLVNDCYPVTGRYKHKEEFVTCGGVALGNLNPKTLECRHHPGLYFAGEVTDVDAVTGGFNLQAAWTMGYVVAKAVSSSDEIGE